VTAVMPASIEADLVVGCGFQFILLVVSGSGLVVGFKCLTTSLMGIGTVGGLPISVSSVIRFPEVVRVFALLISQRMSSGIGVATDVAFVIYAHSGYQMVDSPSWRASQCQSA